MIIRARHRLSLVILSFGCLLASVVHAEESPVAKPDLSSEEALVRYALSHNPELRAVHWNEEVASAGVKSAQALNNPIARAEWLHVQSPANYGWGVGLEWVPPQPGVYGATGDAARAQVRATKADYGELTAQLEASVRASCAQLGALTEEVALAERSIETRRAIHAAVKDRLAHGASSRIDVSLAAVSLARGEQERDQLLMNRTSELTKLEALLGLPLEQSLDAPSAPSPATAPALPAGNSEQRAIARRPQLQADDARAEAAGHTADAERARRWPWLALQARYRRNDQSNYPDDLTLGLELSLPIFNQNPGPIAAAEATRRSYRDLQAAHRMSIERDVRVLRAESTRRREIAEHYAQSIAPVLREHAALVKQAMTGLEVDLTALLTAEDMVTKSGIEYLEARLAQRRAEIALSRALGDYGRPSTARPK